MTTKNIKVEINELPLWKSEDGYAAHHLRIYQRLHLITKNNHVVSFRDNDGEFCLFQESLDLGDRIAINQDRLWIEERHFSKSDHKIIVYKGKDKEEIKRFEASKRYTDRIMIQKHLGNKRECHFKLDNTIIGYTLLDGTIFHEFYESKEKDAYVYIKRTADEDFQAFSKRTNKEALIFKKTSKTIAEEPKSNRNL